MRKTIALAALVAAATTGWPGVASADRARVAAVVNGDVITTDDVTEAIARGGEQPQAGAPADEALAFGLAHDHLEKLPLHQQEKFGFQLNETSRGNHPERRERIKAEKRQKD